MENLEIKLVRKIFSETATIGELFVDGKKLCDTLEDTRRNLPPTCPYTPKGESCKCPEKVYGKTCIPEGRYKVVYRYSPKFGKMYAALENVPHFLGILIHSGTNVGHTEGCILVGEVIPGKEELKNSFPMGGKVKVLVSTAIEEGREVYITIE